MTPSDEHKGLSEKWSAAADIAEAALRNDIFDQLESPQASPQVDPLIPAAEDASPDTSRDNQPLVSGDASTTVP